ncbi:hypothetical protein NJ7G_3700 [Natrinema sp. J7-2]|nr:hypothetical protein NJ7G_3700 [Natrinema sp. J7-2]
MSVVVTAAGQSTMDDPMGRSRALGGDARTLVLRSPCSERTHQEDSERLPNRARGGGAVGTETAGVTRRSRRSVTPTEEPEVRTDTNERHTATAYRRPTGP